MVLACQALCLQLMEHLNPKDHIKDIHTIRENVTLIEQEREKQKRRDEQRVQGNKILTLPRQRTMLIVATRPRTATHNNGSRNRNVSRPRET